MDTASNHKVLVPFHLKLFYGVLFCFMIFTFFLLGFQHKYETGNYEKVMYEKLKDQNNLLNEIHTNPKRLNEISHSLFGKDVIILDIEGTLVFQQVDSIKDIQKILKNSDVTQAFISDKEKGIRQQQQIGKEKFKYLFVTNKYNNCIIISAAPYSFDLIANLHLHSYFIFFVIFVSIIMIVIWYAVVLRFGRVSARLKEFTELVKEGKPVSKETIKFPNTEIGELSEQIISLYTKLQETQESLNIERERVVNSLEDQIRIKKQLTHNISHELKTPISSIQGYLETILNNNNNIPPETVHNFLTKCLAQANRLTYLLRDISTINRMTEAPNMIYKTSVNIYSLVNSILSEVTLELEENDMSVVNTLTEDIGIRGNESLLYSIFRNLIDNAIAYAGNGTTIRILCEYESEDKYHFTFSDNGQGVEDQHRAKIFERFYRIDKGRSRKMGGTGLGLSIVNNAIKLHGGIIELHQGAEGGCDFVFSLDKGKEKGKFIP